MMLFGNPERAAALMLNIKYLMFYQNSWLGFNLHQYHLNDEIRKVERDIYRDKLNYFTPRDFEFINELLAKRTRPI